MLSAGEVLDIRDKESQDSENDDADNSSYEYRNNELQCYFVDEVCSPANTVHFL